MSTISVNSILLGLFDDVHFHDPIKDLHDKNQEFCLEAREEVPQILLSNVLGPSDPNHIREKNVVD